MPLVTPLTRASGCAPPTKAGPTNAWIDAAVPRGLRDRPDRAVEGGGRGDVFRLDAADAVERQRRRIDEEPAEDADQDRELFRGVRAADVHRRVRLREAEALRVGQRGVEARARGHRRQDRVRGAVEDRGDAGRARRERPPLEAAEERHAGDAARFVAQRGRAPAGELRQLVAVGRDQRLVRRHDRDAAIERAAHQRKRGSTPPSASTMTSTGSAKNASISLVMPVTKAAAARGRDVVPNQRGGDDRRESARGEVGGGLARVAREGGADVAEAQQADPARCRNALGLRDRRGRGRSVEHGRSHDERSAGCARDTHVPRNDPAVNAMRASGRP